VIHITSFRGAMMKKVPPEKQFSIANTAPKWWKGETIKELTPGNIVWDYKQKKIDEKEYYALYLRELEKLENKDYNWENLRGKYLLCWEPAGEFCHRRILARFLCILNYHVVLDGTAFTYPEDIHIPGVD